MRAALAWSTAAPERAELGLRLVSALTPFFESRGHWPEGRSWLERAIEQSQAAPARALANALTVGGHLVNMQADTVVARGYLERALQLWREQPPDPKLVACLRNLALVTLAEGDPATGCALCEEALALATKLGDRAEAAVVHWALGDVSLREGNTAAARAHYETGLAIGREAGRLGLVAIMLPRLGWLAEAEGDLDGARARFEEGLATAQRIANRKEASQCLLGLAAVALLQGDEARAEALAEESVTFLRLTGASQGAMLALSLLTLLKSRRGDDAAALSLYEERLVFWRQGSDTRVLAASMLKLAALSPAAWAIAVEQAAADTVLKLAESEARQGRPEQAARLLGARRSVRWMAGRPLSEGEQSNYALVAEALADVLGAAGFDAAMETGSELSLEQAVAEALKVLEAAGGMLLRRAPDAAPGSRAAYPDGLTGREVEIIRLIATGLSNSQIADDLVVSTRKVERHIENIYGKLGVHGKSARTAVAAYAGHGLLPVP